MTQWWLWYQELRAELQTLMGLLLIAAVILIFDRFLKHLIKKLLQIFARDRRLWISHFFEDRHFVFWLLSFPYLTIIHQGLEWVPHLPQWFSVVVQRSVHAGYVVLSLFLLTSTFRLINDLYTRTEVSKLRPIKGYLQGILILAYFLGFILVIAILLNKSPLVFLSGLGALTAILMLIFKDSILSFIAGVQLTVNDLIRVGDWIEMPQFNADGDVIDIALHAVKIQNWDKTITVIPAHKFLENAFKNWRGMTASGGRRIKRAIYIDVASIRFLEEDELDRLGRFRLLKDYIVAKRKELEEYNKSIQDPQVIANARRLTNVGTFRAYLTNYIQTHPHIHREMTAMVRQLALGPKGLPLEIYAFTNTTSWVPYENIQSDIFDHVLAIAPEFGLRVFQEPSGADIQASVKSLLATSRE